MTLNQQVFQGVKTAAFTTAVVGNLTARFLSDYGAEVVCIETATRPDVIRSMPPFKDNISQPDRAGFFAAQHPNHCSITLNLSRPQALDIAKRLVKWADIMAENFAPGVVKRWGLSYEEVKKIKPDIIMISMSNQGHTGPHMAMAGYGTHLTALTGFTHLSGWPDRSPSKPWGAYTDFVTPVFAATALIAALVYRRKTGKGQYIDFSQYEGATQYLAPLILDAAINGRDASRSGNQCACSAPHAAYRCRGNDRWCVITVFTDAEWQGFCRVLGHPQWAGDSRFATMTGRLENCEELDRLVQTWTVRHSAEEVMTLMQRAGIGAGVVQTCENLYQDPQLEHRRHFVELNHRVMGPHAYPNLAFRLSRTPAELRTASPCLGEHNEHVYKHILGLSEDEVADLLAAGVLE